MVLKKILLNLLASVESFTGPSILPDEFTLLAHHCDYRDSGFHKGLFYTLQPEKLDYLLTKIKKTHSPIHPMEYLKLKKNGNLPNYKTFLLSFDDGLKSIKNVLPVLKNHNVSPLLFVNPDFVEREAGFYKFQAVGIRKSRLKNKLNTSKYEDIMQPMDLASVKKLDQLYQNLAAKSLVDPLDNIYLDIKEIESLYQQGVVIGAHSMRHLSLDILGPDKYVTDAISSIKWVRENFPQEFDLFAYPFGDDYIDKNIKEKISDACDFCFGLYGLNPHPQAKHISRLPIDNLHPDPMVRYKAAIVAHALKKLVPGIS